MKVLGPPTKAQNIAALVLVVLFVVIVATGGWYLRTHRSSAGSEMGAAGGSRLAAITVNGLNVMLQGELRSGASEVQIEFKDSQGRLVDAGTVKLGLAMNMPGMVMHSESAITGGQGRYTARVTPQMTGEWIAKLGYSGPQGSGEASFKVYVQ